MIGLADRVLRNQLANQDLRNMTDTSRMASGLVPWYLGWLTRHGLAPVFLRTIRGAHSSQTWPENISNHVQRLRFSLPHQVWNLQ